ncbi:MAG: DUF6159 family protein [Patescibacteria group bacterium]
MPPITPTQPVKMGKFATSLAIVRQSWAILKQDKEIMLFPVVSAITTGVALCIMGLIYVFAILGVSLSDIGTLPPEQAATSAWHYLVLLGYYIILCFIIYFFEACIFIIAHARMSGQDLSFMDGVRGSLHRVGAIFIWSCISATVGVLLRAIADRSELIGKIVAFLFGAAWNLLTYFSLPLIVVGNMSVAGSFKESATMIRKTWGETIIGNVGVGLVSSHLILLGFLASIGAVVLAGDVRVAIGVGVVFVLYVVILSIVFSSLSAIFKMALYEYARTGTPPQGFSPELVARAMTSKTTVPLVSQQ